VATQASSVRLDASDFRTRLDEEPPVTHSDEPSGADAPRSALIPAARVLETLTLRLEPVVRVISAVGVLVLLGATVFDVAGRTFTGHGVPGVIEITEVLLVVVVFIGLMTAARDGQHIRVTLLTDRVPGAVARVLRSIGLLFSLAIVGWLIASTTTRAVLSVRSAEYRFGLVSVPIWPARVAIPLGLACLAIVLLFLLVAQVAKYPTRVAQEREPFEELLDSIPGAR
jgi:TRAP-type C4-dicarboxylate transport system permease small subunit